MLTNTVSTIFCDMERLREGARTFGIELDDEQLRAFQIYLDELLAWNQKFNLTSITDPDQIISKHFLDSLSLFTVLSPQPSALSILDLGAGAGFPVVALKIVRPDWRVTLLEATRKKCDFLQHMLDVLQLQDARVLWGRAETIAHEASEREQYDLVVARAVAELSALAEYMLPFAKPLGVCVAWKGEQIEAELNAAKNVYGQLGGRLREVKAVQVPGIEQQRHLVVIEKVSRTPRTYPRREGVPSKKPLT